MMYLQCINIRVLSFRVAFWRSQWKEEFFFFFLEDAVETRLLSILQFANRKWLEFPLPTSVTRLCSFSDSATWWKERRLQTV